MYAADVRRPSNDWKRLRN